MIETILLAVGQDDEDRSEALVEQTIAVAKPTNATVIVAHVLSENEYEGEVESYREAMERIGLDVRERELTPEALARETEPVNEIVTALEEAGVDVEIRAAVGNRAAEITRLAEELDVDNLIIGGQKRSPAGKAVFGDTAQQILLTAPCPVTYVREE